jgi:hypothetical protein
MVEGDMDFFSVSPFAICNVFLYQVINLVLTKRLDSHQKLFCVLEFTNPPPDKYESTSCFKYENAISLEPHCKQLFIDICLFTHPIKFIF